MEELGLVEALSAASMPVKVIIGTMTVMGFGCVYVAVERTWALGKARGQSRALAAAAAGAMAEGGAEAALEVAKKEEYKDAYLGRLLVSALTEFTARRDKHGIEAAERALRVRLSMRTRSSRRVSASCDHRRYLPVRGTRRHHLRNHRRIRCDAG